MGETIPEGFPDILTEIIKDRFDLGQDNLQIEDSEGFITERVDRGHRSTYMQKNTGKLMVRDTGLAERISCYTRQDPWKGFIQTSHNAILSEKMTIIKSFPKFQRNLTLRISTPAQHVYQLHIGLMTMIKLQKKTESTE
ncbi:unnamed protein product [Dovyalis caffra]|uniref:Uncharacterized protein n=1 Tax=Dovyalis caffra TaxID=77055 RepID=A0AAV1RQ04_9ROSI|nr:unnamed protein product [Dovyalis caffra]